MGATEVQPKFMTLYLLLLNYCPLITSTAQGFISVLASEATTHHSLRMV